MPVLVCAACHQPFRGKSTRGKAATQPNASRYCSWSCYLSVRPPKVERRCEVCQQPFMAHHCWVKKAGWGRFCSLRCKGQGLSIPTKTRFWKLVMKGQPNDCWIWRGGGTLNGYGNFSIRTYNHSTTIMAHRYAYEITYGMILPGFFIHHRCHTRRCVNPAHLQIATPQQNTDYMVQAGRAWWTIYRQQKPA
jgi:hypothetical protein